MAYLLLQPLHIQKIATRVEENFKCFSDGLLENTFEYDDLFEELKVIPLLKVLEFFKLEKKELLEPYQEDIKTKHAEIKRNLETVRHKMNVESRAIPEGNILPFVERQVLLEKDKSAFAEYIQVERVMALAALKILTERNEIIRKMRKMREKGC